MTEQLSGKVAVVTGGASGIGKGVAARLKDAGATVVISDIDAEALAHVCAELNVSGITTDVSDAEQVQALAGHVIAEHGHVDILVNNAGVGSMGRIANLTLQDWKWMFDINLWGVIHGINAFLPLLRANPDGGHVINTSSMSGLDSNANMGAYTASKMAVVGLTEVLAKECAEEGGKVKVSVLCPGPVYSNIKDSLRHRKPSEKSGFFDIDGTKDGFLSQLRWMDPLDVGDLVVDSLHTGQLYIITHPELWPPVQARFAEIQQAFGK